VRRADPPPTRKLPTKMAMDELAVQQAHPAAKVTDDHAITDIVPMRDMNEAVANPSVTDPSPITV